MFRRGACEAQRLVEAIAVDEQVRVLPFVTFCRLECVQVLRLLIHGGLRASHPGGSEPGELYRRTGDFGCSEKAVARPVPGNFAGFRKRECGSCSAHNATSTDVLQ